MREGIRNPVKDPVCGTMLDPEHTGRVGSYQGRLIYFCSPGCQDKFKMNPGSFHKKPKSVFGRFLDRLSKASEKEFGSKGPCCH